MATHDTEPGSSPPDPFDETPPPGEEEEAKRGVSFWVELPILIVVALVVAVIIKTFLVQAFYIPSSSMENTLLVNDRVMVNKLAFRLGDVNRGDVIVFDDPRGPAPRDESLLGAVGRNIAEAVGLSTPRSEFIKRVVALPGESIEIREGVVVVNGLPLLEPYVKAGSVLADFGPVEVPPGHVFVMGDNRNASQDSRFFGPIAEEDIVGRAFVIIWPPSRWDTL